MIRLTRTNLLLFVVAALQLTGCSNSPQLPSAPLIADASYPAVAKLGNLSPGDILSVSFLASAYQTDSPYRISTSDVLRVEVGDHPELSRERVTVLPDGFISLPMVGRIQAATRTIDSLQSELVERYLSGNIVSPDVLVSVEESHDPLAPLLALVNQNGQHEPMKFVLGQADYLDLPFIEPVGIQPDFSLLQSEIKRRYAELYGPRLHVLVQLEKATPAVVYVIGEVVNPGPIDYSEPLSPLTAIAAAGGLRATAESADVRLFRRRADNTLDNWSINLQSRLEQGQGSDDMVPMAPMDVIYVPRSGIAEANLFIEQYIRNMLPIQFFVGGQVDGL